MNFLDRFYWKTVEQPFHEAQIAEVNGKNAEAIEKYIGVLYMVTFTS